MMRMALLMVPVLVAGCTTLAPPAPERGPCVVDAATRLHFAAVKFKPAMRPEIERMTHSALSRVLHPGDVTTRDYRAERLNIMLDDGGLIDGLRCG